MEKRSKHRRLAVQAVFGLDFGESEPKSVLDHIPAALGTPSNSFAKKLVVGVSEEIEKLDVVLRKSSKKWRFSRLGAIEKAILRVALYEMTYLSTPPKVVINEAIEIAKEFGEKESPSLINAILDTVLKSVEKPETVSIKSKGKAI